MKKGKFGFYLWLYPFIALWMVFTGPILAPIMIALFVIGVEKDEWAIKQSIHVVVFSMYWGVYKLIMNPLTRIGLNGETESLNIKIFTTAVSAVGTVFSVINVVITLATIIFVIFLGLVKLKNGNDISLPGKSIVNKAYGVVQNVVNVNQYQQPFPQYPQQNYQQPYQPAPPMYQPQPMQDFMPQPQPQQAQPQPQTQQQAVQAPLHPQNTQGQPPVYHENNVQQVAPDAQATQQVEHTPTPQVPQQVQNIPTPQADYSPQYQPQNINQQQAEVAAPAPYMPQGTQAPQMQTQENATVQSPLPPPPIPSVPETPQTEPVAPMPPPPGL